MIRIAPYDEAEVARLRRAGVLEPEDDPTLLMIPESVHKPRLWLGLVPEARTRPNRVRLQLRADPEGDEFWPMR